MQEPVSDLAKLEYEWNHYLGLSYGYYSSRTIHQIRFATIS